ncbi:hypothetical protein ACWT_0979 [Actinoplanes sp. SE50]|uniref:hypothetical protein n=1 Tax=unclassified Actinoplanes TaxID=2626549 RepID=UPI00023EC8CF|nr:MULTISPECIES: hypothetical protein [unclassified Actinoplanes]AEV81994.1 hypothetical protein ACPL_1097 [Actinoplanes sp. SE50/110]ATO80394.1 hypothetical protein ACWT_0979 [Actinoplanes sp. SE50]SLL97801.1 hypothetical protein ACSP50_1011 [Actinoplanes sp. SE50/110]
MTARERLWGTPPPEDAGAHTADLFDWQAAMAAADSFAVATMHLKDQARGAAGLKAVLCEHHEDYALIDGDDVQIVSVKYRGLGRGAYTWATLADDGGLAHLYARWKGLGRDLGCRMVTNSELKGGDDASGLRDVCRQLQSGAATSDSATMIRSFAVEMLRLPDKADIPVEWRAPEGATKSQIVPVQGLLDDIRAFLHSIEFDTSRPQADDVEACAPEKYVEPLLEQLGLSTLASKAAWNAVLGIFRTRMRGRGKLPLGELSDLIARIKGETAAERLDRTLRRRIVTAQDVILAVEEAAKAPAAYAMPDLKIAATRLAAKLLEGGCTTTAIVTAERFAENWRRERHQYAAVPGMSQEFELAENRLRYVASKIAEEAAEESSGGKYGSRMWRKLDSADLVDALGSLPLPRETLTALGAVCDLASRCQVWFSQEFDVDAKQAELRVSHGAPPGTGGEVAA